MQVLGGGRAEGVHCDRRNPCMAEKVMGERPGGLPPGPNSHTLPPFLFSRLRIPALPTLRPAPGCHEAPTRRGTGKRSCFLSGRKEAGLEAVGGPGLSEVKTGSEGGSKEYPGLCGRASWRRRHEIGVYVGGRRDAEGASGLLGNSYKSGFRNEVGVCTSWDQLVVGAFGVIPGRAGRGRGRSPLGIAARLGPSRGVSGAQGPSCLPPRTSGGCREHV